VEGRLCTVQSRHDTDTASRPPARSLLAHPPGPIALNRYRSRSQPHARQLRADVVAHDARADHLQIRPRSGGWRLKDEPCHHPPLPDRRLMSRLDRRPAHGSMAPGHQSPAGGSPSVPLAADGRQLDPSSLMAARMSAVSERSSIKDEDHAVRRRQRHSRTDLVAGSRRPRPWN
jgi:hypothetical protein